MSDPILSLTVATQVIKTPAEQGPPGREIPVFQYLGQSTSGAMSQAASTAEFEGLRVENQEGLALKVDKVAGKSLVDDDEILRLSLLEIDADGIKTNIGHNATATSVKLLSSTGTGSTIPAATDEKAGVMTAADRTLLASVPSKIEALEQLPARIEELELLPDQISNKVSKADGYSLVPDSEIMRLSEIESKATKNRSDAATDLVISNMAATIPGIKGDPGVPGIKGDPGVPGIDGKSIELRVTATHLEWRKEGAPTWQELIPIQSIADAVIQSIDTRLLPAGGDDGYVLGKVSDGDYDVGWVEMQASGPVGPVVRSMILKTADDIVSVYSPDDLSTPLHTFGSEFSRAGFVDNGLSIIVAGEGMTGVALVSTEDFSVIKTADIFGVTEVHEIGFNNYVLLITEYPARGHVFNSKTLERIQEIPYIPFISTKFTADQKYGHISDPETNDSRQVTRMSDFEKVVFEQAPFDAMPTTTSIRGFTPDSTKVIYAPYPPGEFVAFNLDDGSKVQSFPSQYPLTAVPMDMAKRLIETPTHIFMFSERNDKNKPVLDIFDSNTYQIDPNIDEVVLVNEAPMGPPSTGDVFAMQNISTAVYSAARRCVYMDVTTISIDVKDAGAQEYENSYTVAVKEIDLEAGTNRDIYTSPSKLMGESQIYSAMTLSLDRKYLYLTIASSQYDEGDIHTKVEIDLENGAVVTGGGKNGIYASADILDAFFV